MGAVEAISLSILVGSSVDYCLHLVEGYLLAGDPETSGLANHSSVWFTIIHYSTNVSKYISCDGEMKLFLWYIHIPDCVIGSDLGT